MRYTDPTGMDTLNLYIPEVAVTEETSNTLVLPFVFGSNIFTSASAATMFSTAAIFAVPMLFVLTFTGDSSPEHYMKAVNPAWDNQKRRQRLSDLEDLKNARNHKNMMKNSGGGNKPPSKVVRVIGGVVAGAGVWQEVTNPDPSKEANEAYNERAYKTRKQEDTYDNWIEALTKWLNK